jgi:hypothetical protein
MAGGTAILAAFILCQLIVFKSFRRVLGPIRW